MWEETQKQSKMVSGKRLLKAIKRGNWEIKDGAGKVQGWSECKGGPPDGERGRCQHGIGRNRKIKSQTITALGVHVPRPAATANTSEIR